MARVALEASPRVSLALGPSPVQLSAGLATDPGGNVMTWPKRQDQERQRGIHLDTAVLCSLVGLAQAELKGSTPQEVKESWIADTPLARLQKPEDVAEAVGFLLSSKARFITGEALSVNGGAYMD
jgi:NAD(P)-dependent dehydrogenase (short-subunit alcohol dehydrogenase family)